MLHQKNLEESLLEAFNKSSAEQSQEGAARFFVEALSKYYRQGKWGDEWGLTFDEVDVFELSGESFDEQDLPATLTIYPGQPQEEEHAVVDVISDTELYVPSLENYGWTVGEHAAPFRIEFSVTPPLIVEGIDFFVKKSGGYLVRKADAAFLEVYIYALSKFGVFTNEETWASAVSQLTYKWFDYLVKQGAYGHFLSNVVFPTTSLKKELAKQVERNRKQKDATVESSAKNLAKAIHDHVTQATVNSASPPSPLSLV